MKIFETSVTNTAGITPATPTYQGISLCTLAASAVRVDWRPAAMHGAAAAADPAAALQAFRVRNAPRASVIRSKHRSRFR